MLAQDFHFHSSDSLQILAIVDESLIPSLPPFSFLSLGGQNLTVKLRLASNQDLSASNLCLYFYIKLSFDIPHSTGPGDSYLYLQ